MPRLLLFLFGFILIALRANSQVVTSCPQNIGFETGDLTNWQTYYGSISQTSQNNNPNSPTPPILVVRPAVVSVEPAGPYPNIHQVIKKDSITRYDSYGGFPLESPNGSDYIIKLGNNLTARGAEAISYTLKVPDNVDSYSVIFSYAVVFQNPGHDFDEQPKFTARVFDMDSGDFTECGSFEFVADGALPGFRQSPADQLVLYKPWSPVFVNLSQYKGKTIRLEFTTNDCSRGGHFGYAYIDFNENCSIPITGNIKCPEATSLTLKTLPGFYSYRWFNAETGQDLGNADSLVLNPVPPAGARYGVELIPYQGLGCTQTLYTTVENISMTITDPEPDCISVDLTDISLKVGNSSDLTYTYWVDEEALIAIPNPRAVKQTGVYYIKGTSSSGCERIRPVNVYIIPIPPIINIAPLETTYPGKIDLSQTFAKTPGMTYTYWADAKGTIPLHNYDQIGKKGTYYVKTTTPEGCFGISPLVVTILIPDIVVANTFTPNGDGVNDLLTILLNKDVVVDYFKIFNRWGEVVYLSTDYESYWDGFKDKKAVPAGVYYWALEGIKDNEKYFRSGYLTLLR